MPPKAKGLFGLIKKFVHNKKTKKKQKTEEREDDKLYIEAEEQVLDRLFSFIENTMTSKPGLDSMSSKRPIQFVEKDILPSSAMTEDQAAQTIQRMWRTRRMARDFYSSEGSEAYWRMLDRQNPALVGSETNLLAKIMYGKTIAAIRNDINFPVTQYPDWPQESHYHRVDHFKGKLFNEIVGFFVNDIDSKKNIYVPIILVQNASFEDLQKYYFSEESLPYIKIHTKAGENLAIVEIDRIKQNELMPKIQSSGLIASPWELAKVHAKYQGSGEKESIAAQIEDEGAAKDTLDRLLPSLPRTSEELKDSKIMTDLSQMAVNINNPNRLLASCLHRMVSALPENEVDQEAIQRIALFLSFGTRFYSNDYERFSFSVYAVTHEISLFLQRAIEQGHDLVNYNSFKRTVEQQAIASFSLSTDENPSYRSIAAPAGAGAHSFMVAMDLAKQMNVPDGKEPIIRIIGSKYYEFDKFFPQKDQGSGDEIADIYHLSVGPIVNSDGIHAGVDINRFIRNQLLAGKEELTKPVTLVIDVTTGLHKNLKLDDDVKKLVESGMLSIICYESYQKFGLAHTDQVQGGVVYGICGKEGFSPECIDTFEQKAEEDLHNHIDMVVASYMHEHSGDYIERIKEQHFRNGALFRSFFSDFTDYKQSEVYYNDMLMNLNELYFFIIANEPRLQFAADVNFRSRGGFGHFGTTLAVLPKVDRLSPNASDSVDALIQISQLYLTSMFNKEELFSLMHTFLKKQDGRALNRQEEIIFTGLLIGIQNLSKQDPLSSIEEYEMLYATYFLLNSAQLVLGRNAYHTLSESTKSTSIAGSSSTDFINRESVHQFLRSNPDHRDAMRVLYELKKLSNLEHAEELSEQYKHKAIISLHFSHLWNEENPISNKQIRQFNFASNPLICEAIVALKKHDMLAKDILFILLSDSKNAEKLAKNIVKFNNSGSLDTNSLGKLLDALFPRKEESKMKASLGQPAVSFMASIQASRDAKKSLAVLKEEDGDKEELHYSSEKGKKM